MKTRLVFVRHGETKYNLRGLFQGQVDSELTPKGIKQAKQAAKRIEALNVDVIYSSPLQRAAKTARILRGNPAIEIKLDDRLKEICGGAWEGIEIGRIIETDPVGFSQWESNPQDFNVSGGESFHQVLDRVSQALKDIIELNQGKTVLIVSHMISILLMLLHISGDVVENVWKIGRQPNTAITIVEVEPNGRVDFLINGDNSHLDEADISKPEWDPHGK